MGERRGALRIFKGSEICLWANTRQLKSNINITDNFPDSYI